MNFSRIGLFLLVTVSATLRLNATEKPFAFGSVRFEENRGQTDRSVRYIARARGQQIFFTDRGVVLVPPDAPAVRISFDGATAARWSAAGQQLDSISYYIGRDPDKWVTQAPVYDRLHWRGVYPGIDAVFYGRGDRLEYDLILAPNADPSRVRVRFSGSARAAADDDGTIQITAGQSVIRQRAPAIYQETESGKRRAVTGRFVASASGGFRLEIGNYERSKPLVVDPVLEMATYTGGENDDEIVAAGEGYVAGNTRSVGFPSATPAIRRSRDVFIRGTGPVIPGPVTPSSSLIGTIIIGGSGDDELGGVARVPAGSQWGFLAGTTQSRDFPAPTGSSYRGGASDGFVVGVFAGSSVSVAPMGFFGGSGEDRIHAIAPAVTGFMAVGETDSPDLPAGDVPQRSLAGGKDAFYICSAFGQSLYGYMGGSGDDSARAVAVRGFTFWIGGETRSPDFSFPEPGLLGESDAFLAQISLFTTPGFRVESVANYRIGGAGEDSIRAVTTTLTSLFGAGVGVPFRTAVVDSVAFAGVTSSADLPVRNPAQAQFGGERDAFVGVWSPTAREISLLTYLGGSGVDEATSVAMNWKGDLHIGGWTRSTDLPVMEPWQPANAGGEDGMYAFLESHGPLRLLTYYGGSGDDRIRALTLIWNYVARVAGSTSSSDLPQLAPWQNRGRGLEGFVADIGADVLTGPNELILAKDSAFTLSLRAAKTANRVPVTYRSSDPSRVRFVLFGRSVDQATAPAEDNMLVEALSDSGEVEITASAEGFPAKTIRVKLYPGAFEPVLPAGPLSTWTNVNLSAGYRAIDPATGQPVGNFLGVRPGLSPPVVSWTSSDPGVFEVVNGPSGTTLRALRAGEATLTLQVEGFQVTPSQSFALTAEAPKLAITGPFRVAKDFSRGMSFGFTFNGISLTSGYRGTLTARSEDPGRLLVSVFGAADTMGREQVTVNLTDRVPGIVMHALAGSGEVRVILTSSEFEGEVPLTVRLEPAVLRWGAQRFESGRTLIEPSYRLFQGQQAAEPVFTFETESGDPAGARRSGAPELIFTLTNSNPRVVELNRLTSSQGNFNERYKFIALSAGTAELSLAVSDPEIRLANATVRVDVENSANLFINPTSLVVGKDLQASLTLRSTAAALGFVVASDDPSAVLISTNFNSPGSAQVTLTGRNDETVYLHGLKATGETSVRVRIPGIEEREVKVRLLPSAAGFAGIDSFPFPGFDRAVRLGLWAYDPETGVAIQNQALRPGVEVTVNLRAEGANIRLARDTVVLTTQSGQQSVAFTNPPAGEDAVLIAESPGFAPSPQIGRFDLRIAPQPVVIGAATIIDLSQYEIRQFSFQSQVRTEITVTSLNPDLVLLSGTASGDASASVRSQGTISHSIFLHGLAASGAATVLVEAQGRTPTTITVALRPLRYAVDFVRVAPGATAAARISWNAAALRPGAGPWRFTVRSRNPEIATVQPESIELREVGFPNPSLVVTGVSVGRSEITLEGPSDVYVIPSVVVVSAAAPAAFPFYTVGKNLQSGVNLTLPSGVENPNGTILTITSADPDRLVLSRSASTEGTATLNVAVPAGQRQSQMFYLQALAGDGAVALTTPAITGPAAMIQLTPSWIGCATSVNPFRVPVGGATEVHCSARYPVTYQGQPAYASGQVRPAFAGVPLQVSSNAPAVLAIASGSFSLGDRSSLPIGVRGVAPGEAILRVEQLPGFGPAPDGSDALPVQVSLPVFPNGCGSERIITKDTQSNCQFQLPPGTPVTVTSKNPSLLLVSRDPSIAGASSVTFDSAGQVTLQALASFGTAEVVLSAPGYKDAMIAVAMRPTVVQVSHSSGGNNLVLRRNTTAFLSVVMENSRTPRAGANTTFEFSAEPGGVISFDQNRITLTPQRDRGSVEIRGVNAGPAVVRMSLPEGFAATGVPLAVSVIE